MELTASWNRAKSLPGWSKLAWVAGGYAMAILLAFGVAWIYIEATSGPERDASAGMYAFGDLLLFLVVLGIASLVPTGLLLAFLRQNRIFWIAVCGLSIGLAATGVAGALFIAINAAMVEAVVSLYGFFHWFMPMLYSR